MLSQILGISLPGLIGAGSNSKRKSNHRCLLTSNDLTRSTASVLFLLQCYVHIVCDSLGAIELNFHIDEKRFQLVFLHG